MRIVLPLASVNSSISAFCPGAAGFVIVTVRLETPGKGPGVDGPSDIFLGSGTSRRFCITPFKAASAAESAADADAIKERATTTAARRLASARMGERRYFSCISREHDRDALP